MIHAAQGIVSPSSAPVGLHGSADAGVVGEGVDRHFARRGRGPEFDMEASWIRQYVGRMGWRVLDIGCGIGALFPVIGLRSVVGLDYEHSGLQRTLRRFPEARLTCADGAILPFSDESFDAITAQHVVEHMHEPGAACTEWRRVLRLGGQLLLITPNSEFGDLSVFDDPTHVRLYDRGALEALIEGNGMIVEDILTLGVAWFRSYHGLPGAWRLRQSVLRHARKLARIPGVQWSGQSLCCVARRVEL